MSQPLNPRLVLLAATILPGSGQVLNRQPIRGLTFVFFIILLGAFTLKTASPDVSLVGKLAGGLFAWALAMMDAYKTARVRFEVWRHGKGR
ncbi:hypothetical protein [Cypionkella sp. TWP1-2-1b2]|uniref:hypothetical protein n=1 Tax=Cypionkella sp. TWP1-2-1b2 TaxID=2804675 RepID=UPI003CEB712B